MSGPAIGLFGKKGLGSSRLDGHVSRRVGLATWYRVDSCLGNLVRLGIGLARAKALMKRSLHNHSAAKGSAFSIVSIAVMVGSCSRKMAMK